MGGGTSATGGKYQRQDGGLYCFQSGAWGSHVAYHGASGLQVVCAKRLRGTYILSVNYVYQSSSRYEGKDYGSVASRNAVRSQILGGILSCHYEGHKGVTSVLRRNHGNSQYRSGGHYGVGFQRSGQ